MTGVASTKISSVEKYGEGKVLIASTVLTPNESVWAEVLSEQVPTGKSWRIQRGDLVFGGYGRWMIYIDNVLTGGGETNPENCHDHFIFPDFFDIPSEKEVKVVYLYQHGPSNAPLDVYVGVIEF